MSTLKFKEGVKGFMWNPEEGSVEWVYNLELSEAEVAAYNKLSPTLVIFDDIKVVADSFGLAVGGRFVIEGWGLEEVVEVV